MSHVRIHGDPFGDDVDAKRLRAFLRLAQEGGMRCSLSLSAVRMRAPAPGDRIVALTDGVRDLRTATALPPAELERVMHAANVAVAATAPLVVFADAEHRADAARLASLEWPRASSVFVASCQCSAESTLDRIRAEIRWAGVEHPEHSLSERELQAWLTLPVPAANGPVVHVGGDAASGTDLVVDAWVKHFAPAGRSLRLVLPYGDDAAVAALRQRLAAVPNGVAEIVRAAFEPSHVRDAIAIVQPWRRINDMRDVVRMLASGRVLCASRFAANASLLAREGTCAPIGGRPVAANAADAAHFAPDERSLVDAWREAITEREHTIAIGDRAQRFVVEELTRERPASPPPPVVARHRDPRPTVVLEAPFFENSSSAELSIETARALVRRGNVDVRLVARTPFRSDLATLRRRAPELEARFVRDAGRADLWLSSGWPVRADRPRCATFALRIDQEYGALPTELAPHVTDDADLVVVHSEHVRRTVVAAGRRADQVVRIPHGVDATMHERVRPDAEIVAWKAHRPAVLFCGGLIWRKGFDVFLRAVMGARAAGADFCVVVKTTGLDQHYGKFHLGELLDRFRATAGTPPLLRVDAALTRDELASLYTACDVLVHPYRGEGFCLPVLEARACGLPVIATSGGATDDLMVGPGAIRIPSERRGIEMPRAFLGEPWVVEPSGDDATKLLLDTLANVDRRRAEARSQAASIRATWSWDKAAAAIERLAGVTLPAIVEPVVTLPTTAPTLEPLPI